MKVGLLCLLIALLFLGIPDTPSDMSTVNELDSLQTAFEDQVGPAGKSVFRLPPNAFEVRENLYFLGTHIYEGEEVEGYAILRFSDKPDTNYVKTPFAKQDPEYLSPEKTVPRFELFGKHVRWYWSEGVAINPNSRQLFDRRETVDIFCDALRKWEDESGYPLVGNKRVRVTNRSLEADLSGPDEVNEVYFGPIEGRDIMAVTVVWGVFTGEPETHKLVAWDQVYDDASFIWNIADPEIAYMNPDVIAFERIATEELGYAFGLRELYPDESVHEALYGFVFE